MSLIEMDPGDVFHTDIGFSVIYRRSTSSLATITLYVVLSVIIEDFKSIRWLNPVVVKCEVSKIPVSEHRISFKLKRYCQST